MHFSILNKNTNVKRCSFKKLEKMTKGGRKQKKTRLFRGHVLQGKMSLKKSLGDMSPNPQSTGVFYKRKGQGGAEVM